jgi:hypothetical protein
MVNAITETIAVYSEKHMKPVITFCGQNAEWLDVKAGNTSVLQNATKC